MLNFDWDTGNIEHIALHGVSVDDAEYVLTHPTLDLGVQDWDDEERFGEVGETAKGRILVVVTTWRGDRIRVVTAFDASNSYAVRYRRFRVNR
jgi:uncharacterized DUF497 family protein